MIIKGSNYGDPREQATRENPHGLTPNTIEQLHDRFEQFLPGMTDTHGTASKAFFEGLLPKGAELSPMRRQANCPTGVGFPGFGGSGGNTMITPQRPYMPEYESQDRQCCIEGTKINMADGSYKNIEDIKVGDKVLDKTGRAQTVEEHWCSGIPEKIVEIILWGSTKIYVTTNHNLPGRIPTNYEPFQKLSASELHVGDFLLMPRKFDPIKTNIINEKARLLGYYISEGNLLKNRSDLSYKEFELTFGIHEENTWIKDCLDIFSKFNIQCIKTIKENRSICRLRTREDNTELVNWLYKHGNHICYNRRLSEDVMHWPVKLKWELITGMFRGDGSQHYRESLTKGKEEISFQVTYSTSSEILANQTQLILAQLGIPAKLQTINGGRYKKHDLNHNIRYRLVISSQYARDLANIIWGKYSKAPNLDNKNIIGSKYLIDDDYIYIPIKSVKLVKSPGAVYNITVTGDHSYLINNIGSYNSYPVHRILANRYWRLFYKLDPVIGNCIDLMSAMPWSDFQLSGEGVTGEIKEAFETMCRETNVLRILEYMVKEFMVLGECAVHNFFDDVKGIWTYIALHNPDQLEVIDAPFIKMEPIVEFIPDDRLRAVLTSSNHLLRQVREQMPPELISRLIARQNIPLSPINMTFIPRRMHPYDTRGTSIISRMWRILMYEDCLHPRTSITRPDGSTTNIKQLVIGDIVVDRFGNSQEITNIVEKHADKLIKIKIQCGWEVECTPTHNWPIVYTNDLTSVHKVQASDIKVGDYLIMPRKIVNNTNFNSNILVIKDYILIPVTEVTIREYNDVVYGITVSGDHSYLIDNVATYNSIYNASIATARRHCLVAGTQVLTVDGSKNIEDVKSGDKVWSGDGNIRIVEDAWEEEPGFGLVEIQALGNEPIKCTPNHKFKAWVSPRKCHCGCGQDVGYNGSGYRSAFVNNHNTYQDEKTGRLKKIKVNWKEVSDYPKIKIPSNYKPLQEITADELRPGDYLLMPRKFKEKDPGITKEQARLFGYYIAEGGNKAVNSHDSIAFFFGTNELDTWCKDAVECGNKFGLNLVSRISRAGPVKEANGRKDTSIVTLNRIKDLWFADWCKEHGGVGASKKILSQDIMQWPTYLKEELIRGYYRGDGSLSKCSSGNSWQVACGTVSRTLAYQIRMILGQLGCFSSISHNPRKKKGRENWNNSWIISSTGPDARYLARLVWDKEIESPWSKECRKGTKTWFDKDYFYVPIQKMIKHEDDQAKTYNLTVSGDHSYLLPNLATLNSGPVKIAKLGNPQTGWIPSQEHEKRLLQLLAQAELDVNSWIVYHYGIQFEMVGTTDRIMNISQHNDVIERIKLNAIGISRAFLSGEITYACVCEGTTILTSDYKYKNIENIEEDDQIIDKDGKIQTVERAWCEGTPDELYEIKLWGNKKIIATENHRWPVWAWPRTCACGCGKEVSKPGMCFIQNHHIRTGNRYSTVKPKYIDGETAIGGKPRRIPQDYNPIQELRSDELHVGDYLMIPRKFKANKPEISSEQARLLGYYISEGCINKVNNKQQALWFCFSKEEYNTLVNDVCELLEKSGFDNPNKYKYENRNASRAVWNRKNDPRINWFKKHGGEYSYGKQLSKTVMHWPVKYKIELIKGMYFGDGSQYFHNVKNKHGKSYKQFMVVYTTISETLANQLQIILAQLGFYAIIDIEKERVGKKDGSKRRKLYLIKTYGNHARNLSKLIWNKESKADIPKNNIRDRFKVDDDYIYVPIRSIEKVKNDKPVYNLSVTGSHSYLANGFGTYNSSITGLSVFLQRMKSLRNFFVNTWLIPKFFLPIAKINGWVKRSKKELNFRYRVKRSQRELELENQWIVPKPEWEKRLDHNIDTELVSAMNTLEQMGVRFSKTTKYATVGRKFEEELSKIKEEQQYERELNEYIPPEQLAGGPGGPGGGGLPPMPGGPKPTGIPSGAPSVPPGLQSPSAGGGNIPNAPTGGPTPGAPPKGPGLAADKEGDGGGTGPSGKRDPATRETKSVLWDHKGRSGNWSASEVDELCNLIREGHTDSPLWADMDSSEFRRAVNSGDPWQLLEVIEEHLDAEGYPLSDIRQLRKILDSEGILKDMASGDIVRLKEVENNLSDGMGSLNDEQAMNRLSNMLDGRDPEVVKIGDPRSLIVGQGNEDRIWSGDISDIMPEK